MRTMLIFFLFTTSVAIAQQARWDPRMDFNNDGIVNQIDLLLFMQAWQTRAPESPGLPPEVIQNLLGTWTFRAEAENPEPDDVSPLYGIATFHEENGMLVLRLADSDDSPYLVASDPSGLVDFQATNGDGEIIVGTVNGNRIDARANIPDDEDVDTYSLQLIRNESFVVDVSGVWVIRVQELFNETFSVLEQDVLLVDFEETMVNEGISTFTIRDLLQPEVSLTTNARAIGRTLIAMLDETRIGIEFSDSSLTGTYQEESDTGWGVLNGFRSQAGDSLNLSGNWNLEIRQLKGPETGLVETIPGVLITQRGEQVELQAPDGSTLTGLQYDGVYKLVSSPGLEFTLEVFGEVINPNRMEGYLREDHEDVELYSSVVLTRG